MAKSPELPDPTADLGWSRFNGAIQDIFSGNANKHPERTCVVETESHSAPERTFTYRQISEAANVLAHYLIANGIRRGDVVIIYAYRGVDLVIAFMGVLAAGATLSVIDPVNPPERQKIYLEVSQPRAVVCIDNAIRESPLSSLIKAYVETLKLKCFVPGLRLNDAGLLAGGLENGEEIFKPFYSEASRYPGVIVGPDTNPTLSFTSGSTGRPKGVLGRHFSLTFTYPFMCETFGLNEDDVFTMLSSVGHDPIARDIFTPLYLGARVIIPSKEDIQHERLAEWMSRSRATVTVLTPAMGQVLVGGASAKFPSLKRAFFVGDVLTKRDCWLLRELAPNVRIVNMLGSTETGRAVSYYEIPSNAEDPNFLDSMKEIIPAGKGMNDVQLLVVSREDRTRICKVGEVGEIYFRSSGLSEGYLGLPEQTAEKFVQNWFVSNEKWIEEDKKSTGGREAEPWREFYLGPRDRLYKTGDLGKYLPSGDVECTGRADDMVKIRGYRVELGDINSGLSQHPLVRDCVTLLRKDKTQEPSLVAYVVPEFTRWPKFLEAKNLKESELLPGEDEMQQMLRRFRPLRGELREHLKGKLPAYAIPTYWIFLPKFKLNANAKVDRQALPFPDIVEITNVNLPELQAQWDSLSTTEQEVATVWGSLLQGVNAKAIKKDDSFFDLGGHSLLAQQALLTIRRQLKGTDVPIQAFFSDPTLGGFSAAIDRAVKGNADKKMNIKQPSSEDYAADAEKLVSALASAYPTAKAPNMQSPLTIFLTGATGFLGVFILQNLLNRSLHLRVIAHVRAKTAEDAGLRVRNSCLAYGLWRKEWSERLEFVTGDLEAPRLGLDETVYQRVLDEADLIIHNGALVHWVKPYTNLKAPNVLATIEAMSLCAKGKAKRFVFVSSTSVLDTEHYVKLSSDSLKEGGKGVLEDDDLSGSRIGLGTGYGQSKWASEYLVREAGKRGLAGAIVRPGYVLGDSSSGVSNTDDFLLRLLKGCLQTSRRPRIENSLNAVPVNHVARIVAAAALGPQQDLKVLQVTSRPRGSITEFLGALEHYGYEVPLVSYEEWRDALEAYVSEGGDKKDYEQHALMPLWHFVTNDLPANSRASELDDRNTMALLAADAENSGTQNASLGRSISIDMMGNYIAYLCAIGFLSPPPKEQGAALPKVQLDEAQLKVSVGGRGAVN